MASPRDAIGPAIRKCGKTKEQVAALALFLFGKAKFSELTEAEQWVLIATLDQTAEGPYGFTMAPFEQKETAEYVENV